MTRGMPFGRAGLSGGTNDAGQTAGHRSRHPDCGLSTAQPLWHRFPARMTVTRLPLFIHSPERLDPVLCEEDDASGSVRHLVSPHKLPHLLLAERLRRYSDAASCAAPGLPAKRPDLRFDVLLDGYPPAAWTGTLDQLLFRGSTVMDEGIFLRRPCATLIVTDLIENSAPGAALTARRPHRRLCCPFACNCLELGGNPRSTRCRVAAMAADNAENGVADGRRSNDG